MTSQTLRRPQPSRHQEAPGPGAWPAERRAELVLAILRGELTLAEAARRHGLDEAALASWRERFLGGATLALAGDEPRPRRARDRRVYDDVAQAVGNTPLVRLNRVVAGFAGEAFAKLEYMNPTGSAKDRIARFMVEQAARDGRLRPGDTIVEASSGNTALGLGMMAVLRGYRCKVVVRDRTSQEKVDALRAVGVEVERVPSELPPEHPDSYNRVMERVVRETPRSYFPDQHNNHENGEAHYRTTGPELWEQMDGRIDVFVAGVGTGGTISGVARYLKEQDPRVRVVGVEPVGSVFGDHLHGRPRRGPRPYALEGLGDEELIGAVDFDVIDEILEVPDGEAFRCARQLARQDALLGGGSSGAALWGVRQVIAGLGGRPARIATLFPDGAGRYLTKIFNDDWMRARGFLDGDDAGR